MKKICVPGLLVAASALMIAGTAPAFALTAPYIGLSDGTNVALIDAAGTVTFTTMSGSGTCAKCTTTFLLVPAGGGLVQWSGTLGNFTISNVAGMWNFAGSNGPTMDLGFGSVSTSVGGANVQLQAIFTVTGFSGKGPMTATYNTSFTDLTGGTNSGTSSYQFLINNNNIAYDQPDFSPYITSITIPLSGPVLSPTSVTGTGPLDNPFSGTIVDTINFPYALGFSNDISFTATAGSIFSCPNLMLTKSVVGPTTVSPYTKVNYSYLVKNTGNVTLTNVAVTDDNATPTYTPDDFVVCTIPSLAAGASYTCTYSAYPPVHYGANDCAPGTSFNYGNYHPGGHVICKPQSNGDICITYLDDETNTDNTYGSDSSPDWTSGASFLNLCNNSAEFLIYDTQGNICLDFTGNYLKQNSQCLSGYGSGDTNVKSGNSQCLYGYHTSIDDNLNRSNAFANCKSSSSHYSPNWVQQCGYTFTVKASCFGSNGFGGVHCNSVYNYKTKCSGHNQHECVPVNSTATNTAVASTCYNGTTVYSNRSSATVTISCSSQQNSTCVPLTPKCNIYAKNPTNCQPKNGGHDGNNYSYCDALLPKTLTCNGTQFQLGSAEGPCAVSGGTIPLPNVKCSSVQFLACGTNGNQYNQCFTVHYTDGSSTSIYQHLSDWCSYQKFSGETCAITTPYRITPSGGQQYGTINLYSYSIPCDKTKTVASIDCPNNRNVIVHAVTTCK